MVPEYKDTSVVQERKQANALVVYLNVSFSTKIVFEVSWDIYVISISHMTCQNYLKQATAWTAW
jgi:hypothetical protein